MEKILKLLQKNKPDLILFFWSVVCAIGALIISQNICKTYYQNQFFSPDPIEGLVQFQNLYLRYLEVGRINAAIEYWTNNAKCPLSGSFIVLLFPQLLAKIYALTFWVAPLLVIFLFLFSRFIYLRTSNVFFASNCSLLFSTTLVLYSPYFGLAFHLVDIPSGYCLAIAALCFLSWRENLKIKWLVFSALAMSATILFRYAAVMYVFVVFAPLFLFSFYKLYSKTKNAYQSIIKPILILSSIITVCCGYFIIKKFGINFNYYSHWTKPEQGTSGIGVINSATSVIKALGGFFGLTHLIIICVTLLVLFYLHLKEEKIYNMPWNFIWLSFALPFFWIIYTQSDGHKVSSAFLAGFPILFIGLFSVFKTRAKNKILYYLSFFLFAASLMSGVRSYNKAQKLIEKSPLKTSHLELAKKIALKINSKKVSIIDLDSQIDAMAVGLELNYGYQFLVNSTQLLPYFYPEKTAIKMKYQTKTTGEISTILVAKIDSIKPDFIIMQKNYPNTTSIYIPFVDSIRVLTLDKLLQSKKMMVADSVTCDAKKLKFYILEKVN